MDLVFVILIVLAVGAVALVGLAWRLYDMAWPERKQQQGGQGRAVQSESAKEDKAPN